MIHWGLTRDLFVSCDDSLMSYPWFVCFLWWFIEVLPVICLFPVMIHWGLTRDLFVSCDDLLRSYPWFVWFLWWFIEVLPVICLFPVMIHWGLTRDLFVSFDDSLRSYLWFVCFLWWFINESSQVTNKSWVRPIMNHRWRIDGSNVLWPPEIPGVSNNTTEVPEQKKTTSWTPNDQSTDTTKSSQIN